MKLKPRGNKVLARPISADQKTKSGIHLPGTYGETSNRAKIVAVGDGDRNENGERIKIDLEVGDVVFYNSVIQSHVEIDGEKHVMLDADSEVLGVFEGEE